MPDRDAAGAPSRHPEANPERSVAEARTRRASRRAGTTTQTTTRRRHLPRRISAWVLVVLASILIPVSIISVWAIRTVTDTDQYVATLAPLARNPVIVNHLSARATDALFSTHIVQDKVKDALPAKAKPLVTPITNEVHAYVEGLAVKLFSSQQFGSCGTR